MVLTILSDLSFALGRSARISLQRQGITQRGHRLVYGPLFSVHCENYHLIPFSVLSLRRSTSGRKIDTQPTNHSLTHVPTYSTKFSLSTRPLNVTFEILLDLEPPAPSAARPKLNQRRSSSSLVDSNTAMAAGTGADAIPAPWHARSRNILRALERIGACPANPPCSIL